LILRHCEERSDAAIHLTLASVANMDCFAALAMTEMPQPSDIHRHPPALSQSRHQPTINHEHAWRKCNALQQRSIKVDGTFF
jgi:hypothetical protein